MQCLFSTTKNCVEKRGGESNHNAVTFVHVSHPTPHFTMVDLVDLCVCSFVCHGGRLHLVSC